MITLDNQILIYVVLSISVLAIVWMFIMEKRLRGLLSGKNGKSLEDTVLNLKSRLEKLEGEKLEIEKYLATAEKRLKRSIQGVETVRFNPWKGTGSGGNQSFATAMINEDGNGVVISSIYSRERVSVYAKPILENSSPYELSGEEKEAVKKASPQKFQQ